MWQHEQNIRALLEKKGKGGHLQQFAEDFLKRETEWLYLSHPGILEGTHQPIVGKVDLWFQGLDKGYIAVQPSSERSRSKLESDTKKAIAKIKALETTTGRNKVVIFCSRDTDVDDERYCKKLCEKEDIEFIIYNNSKITGILLRSENHDLVERHLGYPILNKRPFIQLVPVEKELYNCFEYKFMLKNVGDDYLTGGTIVLTRHFSSREVMEERFPLYESIEAKGGSVEVDLTKKIPIGNGFNSSVTDINNDFILICLLYQGNSEHQYEQNFKYSFSSQGNHWNPVTIVPI